MVALLVVAIVSIVGAPAGRADVRATEPAPSYLGGGSSPENTDPAPVYDRGGPGGTLVIMIGGAVVCLAFYGVVASRRRARRVALGSEVSSPVERDSQ